MLFSLYLCYCIRLGLVFCINLYSVIVLGQLAEIYATHEDLVFNCETIMKTN